MIGNNSAIESRSLQTCLKVMGLIGMLGLLLSAPLAGAATSSKQSLSNNPVLDRYLEDPPDLFKPPLPTLKDGVPRFQSTVRDQLLVMQFMRALQSDPIYYHASMDLIRINQQRLIIRQLARLLARGDIRVKSMTHTTAKNHKSEKHRVLSVIHDKKTGILPSAKNFAGNRHAQ